MTQKQPSAASQYFFIPISFVLGFSLVFTMMGVLVGLAINIGGSSSKAEKFMQSLNLSFTVLLDTEKGVPQRYNITGIPTTLFIDKDGIIQEKVIGAFQGKAQIENRLSKIMP